jgi:hypothetical protein
MPDSTTTDAAGHRTLQSIEQGLARIFARPALLLVTCLGAAAMVSWALGQDINWDLKNYHLYNPYALLEGRLTTDFVPASLQGFFNPLGDIPYYILSTKLLVRLPRVLAALQGLYYGALVYLVFRLNRRAFDGQAAFPATTAIIAALIGVSASGVVSEIGTTFNDIQGALFVLWGAYLLMPRSEADAIGAHRALWAGIAFGVAIGIKLTSGYYIVAALVAVLASGALATSMRTIARTCLTAGAVALVLSGGWCLWVYHQTGNPVFPVYNELFRSDWYPPLDYMRYSIKPKPFATSLLYPFAWARMNSGVIAEVGFRDARLAAALIAGVVILMLPLLALLTRGAIRRVIVAVPLTRPMRFLFAFALAAYVVWLTLFAVLRYAIVPEALTGTVTVLGIQVLAASVLRPFRAFAVVVLAAAVGIGLQTATVYPTWGRAPYGQRTFTLGLPQLPANSLVVIAGVPLSFVIPFLRPKNFVAVGISHHTAEARGYRLFAETKKRIMSHSGPAFVVANNNTEHVRGLAAELGITWSDDACTPITANVDPELRWCVGRINPAP